MSLLFLWALVGLQIKHYIADYTLQWPWMIAGKCHFNRSGGYLHAGIHILLTLIVLLFCNLSVAVIALLLVFEFVVHYATDYTKGSYDFAHKLSANSRRFWVIHGADQLVHQFTYAVILAVIVYSNQP
ncbi:MAG: DUF3307 domain-containing protein [Pseudomonadota bacterium]